MIDLIIVSWHFLSIGLVQKRVANRPEGLDFHVKLLTDSTRTSVTAFF